MKNLIPFSDFNFRINENIVIGREIPEMNQFLDMVCKPDGSIKDSNLFIKLQGGKDNPKLREQIKKMYLDTNTRKNKKAKYAKEARSVIELAWEMSRDMSNPNRKGLVPESALDPRHKEPDGTYSDSYLVYVLNDLSSKAIDYLTGEKSGIATGFMGLRAR